MDAPVRVAAPLPGLGILGGTTAPAKIRESLATNRSAAGVEHRRSGAAVALGPVVREVGRVTGDAAYVNLEPAAGQPVTRRDRAVPRAAGSR